MNRHRGPPDALADRMMTAKAAENIVTSMPAAPRCEARRSAGVALHAVNNATALLVPLIIGTVTG